MAGTQVSAADTWRYQHFNMAHLRRLLEKADAERPESDKLIVTDGVFSMSGRIAPIPELIKLANEFDAALMLDDAHAVGVIGPGGRGSAAYFGLRQRSASDHRNILKELLFAGWFCYRRS